MFLKQLTREEQINWVSKAQSDLSAIEKSLPKIKKSRIDGIESSDYKDILAQLKEQALETYDIEMEPTIEGLEGFASVLKTAIIKVRDVIKGDRSAHRKIIMGKEKEVEEALKEYTSPEFKYSIKVSEDKIKIKLPAYADTPEKIISEVTKYISSCHSMDAKYAQDAIKCGRAIIDVYKEAEKDKDGGKSYSLEGITPLIDLAPLDKLEKEITSIDKQKDGSVSLMTESQVKDTIAFFKKVAEHIELTNNRGDDLYKCYRIWDFFEDDTDDKIVAGDKVSTGILDERIDDIGFLMYRLNNLIFHACQALEDWMLKSIK